MSKDSTMLANDLLNTTHFLKMPSSVKLLYIYLNMDADSDGIVEAYHTIRKISATPGDLEVLVQNKFAVLLNEDLVTYLPDYLHNNSNVDVRWKKDSIYLPLLNDVCPNACVAFPVRTDKKVIKVIKSVAEYMALTQGKIRDSSRANYLDLERVSGCSRAAHEQLLSCSCISKDKLSKDKLNENKRIKAAANPFAAKKILEATGIGSQILYQLLANPELPNIGTLQDLAAAAQRQPNPAQWLTEELVRRCTS